MARTPSNMLPLGTKAPTFNLLDTTSGTYKNLENLQGAQGTVIAFICNHCPFVIHINKALVDTANLYLEKGINFIAISSNDIEKYPQDSPEKMKSHAHDTGYCFLTYTMKHKKLLKHMMQHALPIFIYLITI